jgi:hypothetical protein
MTYRHVPGTPVIPPLGGPDAGYVQNDVTVDELRDELATTPQDMPVFVRGQDGKLRRATVVRHRVASDGVPYLLIDAEATA